MKRNRRQKNLARVIDQLRAWASSKTSLWLVIDGGFFAIQLTGLVETRPSLDRAFDLITPSKELSVPIFPELYRTLSVTQKAGVVVTMKIRGGQMSITEEDLGAQRPALKPPSSKRVH